MLESLSFTSIAIGIYALECILWVPGDGLAVVRHPWGPFKLLGPGFHVKPPWPSGFTIPFTPPSGWRSAPPAKKERREVLRRIRALKEQTGILNWSGRGLLAVATLMLMVSHINTDALPEIAWIVLIGEALIFHAASVCLLVRCWKDVRGDGVGRALTITAVSPWASIRASDQLSQGLLNEFHPASVAAALLNDNEAKLFIAACLRNAVYQGPGESLDALAWGEWIKTLGWKQAELLGIPARQSRSMAYCPRCLTQFTRPHGDCNECGVPLKLFEVSGEPLEKA